MRKSFRDLISGLPLIAALVGVQVMRISANSHPTPPLPTAFNVDGGAALKRLNLHDPGRILLPIDDPGHRCALASLVKPDGACNELLHPKAVKLGPFNDWKLEPGFTPEEIERLKQPAP